MSKQRYVQKTMMLVLMALVLLPLRWTQAASPETQHDPLDNDGLYFNPVLSDDYHRARPSPPPQREIFVDDQDKVAVTFPDFSSIEDENDDVVDHDSIERQEDEVLMSE